MIDSLFNVTDNQQRQQMESVLRQHRKCECQFDEDCADRELTELEFAATMAHAKQLFSILHDKDPALAEKKLQISIYMKSFYRNVYNDSMKNMSKEH